MDQATSDKMGIPSYIKVDVPRPATTRDEDLAQSDTFFPYRISQAGRVTSDRTQMRKKSPLSWGLKHPL
ncbi:hypothetical protein NDU88_010684 [Pleurodeles waltl]|uniref:Uncharacterized protein n=1 Tax=Pleurodeles waltl TaxID=8319 RepID=A0AAV7QYX7_PLEWA|nr:hypothetical protein NDU88_010684 [Pleurodeles waltl]